jgi:hypothetical protein
MEHGFDIVAVRVQHERCVITRVVRPLAGRTVVGAAVVECGPIKSLDRGTVLGLERQVMTAGKRAQRRFAVRARDEQFVGPEIGIARAANLDLIPSGSVPTFGHELKQ